ncbi:FAD-dependent oxidoreductase [Pararhodospirillum photometricum]|uniref:FAD dependent oxidoreductase n=1 Tax=Pararhodospirillum photometricum DSM 122 TaxID=1150469 RepID=H6SLU7_PARPM|nr:FAD-dependent oxidoreductase [Pararhodospirillum photometricum]CCG08962.1 FAD dependent oxidoreductase [Pararhodospirillum photometricum DSM 122]
MPLALLKAGFRSRSQVPPRELPATPELKKHYDVVIIGAGGHGLATAYHLAKTWNVRSIAVLDKGYLGGGNTARNTAIVRANYLTPEGVAFYKESMELFETLSEELDFNVMYTRKHHMTLAHTDASLRTMRWRAEVNKHLGVESELIDTQRVAELEPRLHVGRDARYPILGALHHPVGGTARHDAVAWGYAIRAAQLGVEIHQLTDVTGLVIEGNRVTQVLTRRGAVGCGQAVQAVAGATSAVARMAGLRLAIRTVPLQACVSQPVKPIINSVIVSGSLHCYIWQSQRGELVMGGAVDPYPLWSTRSTLEFKEGLMAHILELFPFLAEVRVMRQWAGMADMTPDFAPIMGKTPLDNYYIDAGWGTWGFKATPVCGKRMAECVATDRQPELLAPFRHDRFSRFDQVGEAGAASVGS